MEESTERMLANLVVESASDTARPQTAQDRCVSDLPFTLETTFSVVEGNRLTDEMKADWDDIRAANQLLRSPFFSWQFTEDVARVLPNIECLTIQRAGRYIGFFPFERRPGDIGRPVGAGTNDGQGVLGHPQADIDFHEVASKAKLKQYSFHAASPELPGIQECEIGRREAFLADLSAEPGSYCDYLAKKHRTIAKQGQKTRRLERDLGPLRFEFDCDETSMVEKLIELKRAHYQRTHTFDILSVDWIQNLIYQLHRVRDERQSAGTARGILSTLCAGDTPLAMHYGIVEGDLLHYWFPVYAQDFAYGSPGTELFLQVVKTAEKLGIRYIDFGYGDLPYKHKLTNTRSEMSFGIYDQRPLRRQLYRAKRTLRDNFKDIKIRNMLKPVARKLFPKFGISDF